MDVLGKAAGVRIQLEPMQIAQMLFEGKVIQYRDVDGLPPIQIAASVKGGEWPEIQHDTVKQFRPVA
jgi:hypothetical protein